MTKPEAVKQFQRSFPLICRSTDKGLKRQTWNDYVDGLQRDGSITEKQAATWDQPAFVNK